MLPRNSDLLGLGFTEAAISNILATIDWKPNLSFEGSPVSLSDFAFGSIDERAALQQLARRLDSIADDHVARSRLRGSERKTCKENRRLARMADLAAKLRAEFADARADAATAEDLAAGLREIGAYEAADSPLAELEIGAANYQLVALYGRDGHARRCPACSRTATYGAGVPRSSGRIGRPSDDTLERTLSQLAAVYLAIGGRLDKISRDPTQLYGEELLRPGFGRFAWRFFHELHARFPDCAPPSASSLEQTDRKRRRFVPRN